MISTVAEPNIVRCISVAAIHIRYIRCVSTAVCLVAFAGISASSIRFNDNICFGVEVPALGEDKLQNNSS